MTPVSMLKTIGVMATATLLSILPSQAASWTIDKGNSTLSFEAQVFGSAVPGTFGDWTAEIAFDEEALDTSKVSVVIDMSSADTGDGARDGSLKGSEWFAVEEHPEATLVSTAFRKIDDGSFEMDADLTMRGTTNPITLPFTLTEAADGVVAKGSVTVNRTDYGVGQGDYVGGSTVGLDVVISIDIAATPEAGADEEG
ncbi:YceI family protein [Pyruvatibacter sp.]|uniref:YceI family protein n=1 Tax=Pyruvatibacter sp. TaxID=1981328 RepID=UPI003263FFF6